MSGRGLDVSTDARRVVENGERLTALPVDLRLDVEVDAQDEDVAEDVQAANSHQDHRILEGNLLAGLHHYLEV